MLLSPALLHIPDGFLSLTVAIGFWIVSTLMISLAIKNVELTLEDRKVPLMGILAAAIFAAQMLNFAVAGGTSGHLIGAALATILLGPWEAIIVMASVVTVQTLIFQDGGLIVMGANLFNMAIISVFVANWTFTTFKKILGQKRSALFVSGFAAAWLSVFVSALAAALELAVSGTSPANVAIPAMAGVHALIGLGEGGITIGALGVLYAVHRDILLVEANQLKSKKTLWFGGLATVLILLVVSPFASQYPDGLEWVAEQQQFLRLQRPALFEIIPDYVFPGIANEAAATIIAGIIGIILVMLVALGVALI